MALSVPTKFANFMQKYSCEVEFQGDAVYSPSFRYGEFADAPNWLTIAENITARGPTMRATPDPVPPSQTSAPDRAEPEVPSAWIQGAGGHIRSNRKSEAKLPSPCRRLSRPGRKGSEEHTS